MAKKKVYPKKVKLSFVCKKTPPPQVHSNLLLNDVDSFYLYGTNYTSVKWAQQVHCFE